jgi:hypothetical protein
LLELLEDRTVPTIFTVSNTLDGGLGSLRQAILDSNGSSDVGNMIQFAIAGSGVHTINLLSPLPTISRPVLLDGYTQPGASANTQEVGDDAVLTIELNGAAAGLGASGLTISAANTMVRGLVINRFGREGIMIGVGAAGTVIGGNFIGTDVAGTHALGNLYGIHAVQGNTIIGGTTAGARNLISGNNSRGVLLDGLADNTIIQGNFIGTDVTGTQAVGNHWGVSIGRGFNSVIGGTTASARNIISGNAFGIDASYFDGAIGLRVVGNYIGTDVTGTRAVGNTLFGVDLSRRNVTVGGLTPQERNVISGNATGVRILDSGQPVPDNNRVIGNYIGTDVTGTQALGNGTGVRMEIAANANIIGGTAAGAGNVISGNSNVGVWITGNHTQGNTVAGNLIGTNAAGTAALPNGTGVYLEGTPGNTIGGTTSAARNIISGNFVGVSLFEATGNQIQGNYIGTNQTGAAALGNFRGVDVLSASGNTIGGTAAGAGNLISGNATLGVSVFGNSNVVAGNRIGTNAAGTATLPNATGIHIDGANNTIGGTDSGARNLISGNRGIGVDIFGAASTGNRVQGNFIGTDVNGMSALTNSSGVQVSGSGNLIGGTDPGAGNVISGSTLNGILISGTGVTLNTVQGNLIGTNADGTAAISNGMHGIEVSASNTTIGGTAVSARNVVSGNGGTGILIANTSSGTVIQGNYVGTNAAGTAAVRNIHDGIDIFEANIIVGGTTAGAGNLISGNGAGLAISANGATVLGNFIGTNATGTGAIGNGGFGLGTGTGATIGGIAPGARNLISGNGSDGVVLGSSTRVLGNYIGTDVTGTIALRNFIGVDALGSDAIIGGAADGEGNLISGNQFGIELSGNRCVMQGNKIGTNAAGAAALPNSVDGIQDFGTDNLIGGTASGAGNLVSANGRSGILIVSTRTQVRGNRIGTDISGSNALGNGGSGVWVSPNFAVNVVIGGTDPAARNVISANQLDGIQIGSPSGAANVVQGNFIGTDASGTQALGNLRAGVRFDNVSRFLVGGTTAGAGNVISGNATGVEFSSAATGNLLQGNFIGTDVTGTVALGNGVGVSVSGGNNLVGGTDPGAANVISGNRADGVQLLNGTGNAIQGNLIGTDFTGTIALANGGNGVNVAAGANNNTLGGADPAARNIISGNQNDGVAISATGTVVAGNFIGTDVNGVSAVPNGRYGVSVSGPNNTIGGTTIGAGNVISGNVSSGINLISGTNNLVAGNYIGTDTSGTSPLGNLDGVTVNTSNNTIGGITNQAANVISGNRRDGVLISSAGTGNRLLGNFIGTDASGTIALANMLGVFISDGNNNTIGGTLPGAGNLISGNTTYGIEIFRTASANQVQGNFIGTDVNGTAALPNSSGVLIDGGSASNNTIGGAVSGAGNVISGNTLEGVAISSSGNFVQGNFIGTDAAGAAPLPNVIGVSIGGAGNLIGGSGGTGGPGTLAPGGNLISGNTTYGVFLSGTGATLNRVQRNLIGTDATGSAALANGYGVFLNFASNNTIGGSPAAANTIAFNRNDGVLVQFATGDAIHANSIFANAGLGIRLQNGGNNNEPAPVLTSAFSSNGFLSFQGSLTAAVSTTFTIEIFANTVADPSGFGQGERLVAFLIVTTDSTGHASFGGFSFSSDVQPGEFLTATATDPAGNTSAFSNDIMVTQGGA